MSNMNLQDYHRITVYGTTEAQATLKDLKDYVGGGEGNTVSIDDVEGVTAVGLSVAKATSQAVARTAIGAGTSNLTIGTTSTTAMKGDTPLLQIGTTSTTAKAGDWTPPNASATVGGYMTSAQFTKLGGIATGATVNQSDGFLVDRANHTGTQSISTVTGTVPISQLPTGVTATSVALGNHTHTGLVTPTVTPVITITDPPDDENIQASFDALIQALKTAGVLT